MGLVKEINSQNLAIKSLKNIFEECSKIIIPNYQRTYSWKEVNIIDFNNSLEELIKNACKFENESYEQFFGTIMLTKEKENEMKIIDGQQRIVTFFLFFWFYKKKLQEYIKESRNAGVHENEDHNLRKSISFCDQINEMMFEPLKLGEKNIENNAFKLKLNSKIHNEIFEGILKNNYKKPKNLFFRSINKNIEKLNKGIEELFNDEICKKFTTTPKLQIVNYILEKILSKTSFIVLSLSNEENAFAIFDSLNSTGKPLKPFDLVNGFVVTKLEHNEELKNKWIEKINFFQDQVNLDDYLFFILNSKNEEIPKIKMYSETKKYIKEFGISKVVNEIVENFDFLNDFLNDSTFIAQYIKLLSRKKIIPVLIALKDKNYSNIEIKGFITKLLKYSIIELNFKNQSPGIFQYKIRSIIIKIIESKNKLNFDDIKEIPKIKEDFIEYEKTLNMQIEKHLNNEIIKDNQFIKCLFYMIVENDNLNDISFQFENIHIEHVFPKNPHEKWYEIESWMKIKNNDEYIEKITNMIGNLILLNGKINQKMSNNVLEIKKNIIEQMLPKQSYFNSEWNRIKYSEFSPNYVEERTKKIIEKIIYDKIFEI